MLLYRPPEISGHQSGLTYASKHDMTYDISTGSKERALTDFEMARTLLNLNYLQSWFIHLAQAIMQT